MCTLRALYKSVYVMPSKQSALGITLSLRPSVTLCFFRHQVLSQERLSSIFLKTDIIIIIHQNHNPDVLTMIALQRRRSKSLLESHDGKKLWKLPPPTQGYMFYWVYWIPV